jgi:hypothetical protein
MSNMKPEKTTKIRPGPPAPVSIEDAIQPAGPHKKKAQRKSRRTFFDEQTGTESAYMRKG